jgi:hypothetical protein
LTGYIAQSLVKPQILERIYEILPAGEKSLEHAATWADRIKGRGGYHWANQLHYVNGKDSPPVYCKKLEMSDCPARGCILSAITNVTNILRDRRNKPATLVQEALLFLIHFMGDLHQPMHVLSLKQGGNGIKVVFEGRGRKLHEVWDSVILQKRINMDFGRSKERFFASMKERVYGGFWKESLCKCNKGNFESERFGFIKFIESGNIASASGSIIGIPDLKRTAFIDSTEDWFCPLVNNSKYILYYFISFFLTFFLGMGK